MGAMDWTVSQNSYVEALIPNVMVTGDWAFRRYLGFDEALMMGLVLLQEKTPDTFSLSHVRTL